MRKFIIKITLFSSPIILLVIGVIYVDFFKVIGFQDYYSNQRVELNREMVTTTTYNHYREQENFNSFIFGSSRSQAYKCENWEAYLDKDAKPFHFDASAEGIWGVEKKVAYIDKLGDSIKNALVIVDRQLLGRTSSRKGHLFISMPMVSKASKLEYYSTFLRASLDPKFLTAYLDFSLFKTNRGYMESFIQQEKYDYRANKKNGDLWYGHDKEIEEDSLSYYQNLIERGVFYSRPVKHVSEIKVTQAEIKLLERIKAVFDKHKTKYKIVISPLYDQIPMENAQIELLQGIFGEENIYDFSGKNEFTDSIHNFYETSHYRPHVADEIMELIYKD